MRKLFFAGIIVILALVFFGIGFFISRNYYPAGNNLQGNGKNGASLCNNQNAVSPNKIISGKVTKVEGDKIFIEQQLKDAKKEFIITVAPETKIMKMETFFDFSSSKELNSPTSIKNMESVVSDIKEGVFVNIETEETIGDKTEFMAKRISFSLLRADCGGPFQK